ASSACGSPEMDEWARALEGGWAGEQNETPFGPMPFALLFERQDDGSLRAMSAFHSETWIELRLWTDEHGRWRLDEAASLEGLGVQRRTLVPAGLVEGTRRFVDQEDPEFLSIDITQRADQLDLDVHLRGASHVRFRLHRVPDEDLPALREALAAQAARSPEQAGSLRGALEDDGAKRSHGAPPAIAKAREAAAAPPDDARAHMALAQTLGAAIQKDPAVGRRHAYEMLGHLERAQALDPSWPAPYHGLVGYYLNAPRIAGGSVEKASEMARRLAEIDPAAGEQLLAQIARRREQQEASEEASQ
ncbi:MAG: hypothetical protein JSV80_11075, partial [Acidobacteriota bacterium]